MIDQDWAKNRAKEEGQLIPPGGSAVESTADRLLTLLHQWADEFAKRRSDVGNAGLSFGSRGLGEDEAAAFGARWAFQAERDGNALYFTELHNTALANAAETSPGIEDAYALARATEIDGERRAYPYQRGRKMN